MTNHNLTADGDAARRFGAFGGVFVPCVLTILGVIMFMRTGFVVGHVGLIGALGILAIAEAIVIITMLSLSAIATNTEVKGGGAYFMISRTLGAEFGGAIGLALYLAQGTSAALYVFGFTEAAVRTFPVLAPYFAPIALGTAFLVFCMTVIGADWTIKLQYVIFAILMVSVVSFMAGLVMPAAAAADRAELLRQNLWGQGGDAFPFFVCFAIFFPAVTGIESGISMSGDLKNPKRALPLGTLVAIGFTTLVYGSQMVLMASAITPEKLVAVDTTGAATVFEELATMSLIPALVVTGVFAATLSSALGSALGSPRVLQALSADRIFRRLNFFAKGSGPTNEPRRATVLTGLLAVGLIIFGVLVQGGFNIIAMIVTMFFVITYGMVNFAAFYESYGGNPSFRPTWKYFQWWTALLGAAGCAAVMFLVSPVAAASSIVVIVGIYYWIKRKRVKATWGDAKRGFFFARARENLLALKETKADPKNWRPIILVFTGDPETRRHLAKWSSWFEAKRGILSLVNITIGDIADTHDTIADEQRQMKRFIQEEKLTAFGEVLAVQDFHEGMAAFLQSYSIGGLRPNTVVLGWTAGPDDAEDFVTIMRAVRNLKKNLLIINSKEPDFEEPRQGYVDIWWRGQKNGSLMMILAYLLLLNWEWRDSNIRIRRVVKNEKDKKEAEAELRTLAEAARISAEIRVDVHTGVVQEFIKETSRDSALVFLGLRVPDIDHAAEFIDTTNNIFEDMPTTVLIDSAGEADLLA